MKSNLQIFCFSSRLQKGTMLCGLLRDSIGNKSSCMYQSSGIWLLYESYFTRDCRWLPCILLLSLTFTSLPVTRYHLINTVFLCPLDRFITHWISYLTQQGKKQNMYRYIQQDITILSWLLFQELYMFRAFTMPIIRSTLLHRQSLT
jgi:hypothetical protein